MTYILAYIHANTMPLQLQKSETYITCLRI